MDAEITLEGVDKLLKKLQGASVIAIFRDPMYRAVLRLQAAMAKYPPARAGSKYRRSGSYGRKWTHEVTMTADTIVGKAGNNIMYGPYVGSDQFQAHWNRGRWPTDKTVLADERSAIINDFQQAINEAIR